MKKALLILISILLFSCSEEDNSVTEQQENFNLTSETSSVMPLRYVIVNTDIILTENTYNGNLGGEEIELTKSADNELIFIVPEIAQGNQLLEVTIGDQIGALSFEVLNNEVQDIDQVINDEVVTPLNAFNDEISTLLNTNVYNQDVTDQLETSQLILSDYFTKLSQISAAEKREVARFFNANPIFTSDFLNLDNRGVNSNPAWDCLRDNKVLIVSAAVGIAAFVKLVVITGSTSPPGPLIAGVGVIAGVYAAVSIVSAINENVLNECFLPVENLLNDSDGNTDNFEVSNNSFESFSIKTKVRHLVSSDVNGNNIIVATLLGGLNNIKSKWPPIKNAVNNIISKATGWFCGWFTSACSSYNLITYDFEGVPINSDEFETQGDSEFIFIEDFPSDVGVQVQIASDNSIKLKLNAPENTLPRTVMGKIKYDDGDFVTENSFSVTMVEPCLNNNAPVINNVVKVCVPNNPLTVFWDISFTADGIGFNPNGSYFGAYTPENYPVTLEVLINGSWYPMANYNGSASLISGNKYSGVIRLSRGIWQGQGEVWSCENQGNGVYYYHDEYRLKLVDGCGLSSDYSDSFPYEYYKHT